MDWSDGARSLRRGLGIASRVAVARLKEDSSKFSLAGCSVQGHFAELPEIGPNPGHLQLRVYLPPVPVRKGAPLIALLHGCGQDAASFATETGWTALADRLGLPLVLPEQQELNNRARCFQWFLPSDIERGHGEVGSIATMISFAAARFDSDPRRIFVAGLSAGGAMAAAVLAAYPDLLAAGAVCAGLPVGSACSAIQALARMAYGAPECDSAEWIARVRRIAPSGYSGAWPRLSIWHGEADEIVVADNGRKLAAQWRALHGLQEAPSRESRFHQRWGDAVELWTFPGFGHAWPVGRDGGLPGHLTARAPAAAVRKIARFWGIA
jgi:poly(hydroxyalkanoate) depolymerase family esterase